MSPQRDPWTGKDTAQCVGMAALMAGGLLACTDNLSIDDMSGYARTAQDLVLPVAAGVGGAMLAVGVLLLAIRHLRVWLVAAMRAVWLYRRRWASVLAGLGLTETEGDRVRVPRLVSVVRYGTDDVVTVRMLPGQSAVAWHENSAALAEEFGARSAKVSFGLNRHREVVIVFDRAPNPRGPLLALEARKPHPLPLALPDAAQRQANPRYAISVRGVQLRIVWARVRRINENDRTGVRAAGRARYGLAGEMRWATWQAA
ncbi:hypothetical protein ACWDUN_29875 [Mycobacterium sp. NPDC003323]